MAKMNYVLAGDYKDCYLSVSGQYKNKSLGLCIGKNPSRGNYIWSFNFEKESEFVELSKETVESMELATEDNVKSLSSSLARGLVGGLLLGPLGLLAGGITGKSKKTYQIIIHFKDEKKSLIEINDYIYKPLVKALF